MRLRFAIANRKPYAPSSESLRFVSFDVCLFNVVPNSLLSGELLPRFCLSPSKNSYCERLLSVIGQGAKLLLLFYWRIPVFYENYMNHSLPSDIITMMFSLGFAKNKTPSKITLCT